MKTDVYERITKKIVATLKRASARGSSRGTQNTPQGASPVPYAATAFPIAESIS